MQTKLNAVSRSKDCHKKSIVKYSFVKNASILKTEHLNDKNI